MKPHIRTLLEAAVRAPSGENAQPWKFSLKGSEPEAVYVELVPERDRSPYGWGSRASYVAIGAALENMKVAAAGLKKRLDISLFPSAERPRLVAKVSISDDPSTAPDLRAAAVFKRATNRKKYFSKDIPAEALKALKNLPQTGDYLSVLLVTGTKEKIALARAASTNEAVMLSNNEVHSYFFSHVNWSAEEDEKKKVGFFVKTLELPPPAVLGFKLMSKWERAVTMNKLLKMNEIVAKQNASLYASVPVIGAIVGEKESPEEAVRAGMTLERVWLDATRLDLSVQPLAGLLYLMLGIRGGEGKEFTPEQRAVMEEAYKEIESTFNAIGKPIYFMFRAGYAPAPSARAVRFSVDEVTELIP